MNNDIFENNRLYSAKEILKPTGIGLSLFNTLVDNGTIPVIRISERVRKFKGSTLNRIFSEEAGHDK